MTTNSPNPVDGDVQALVQLCNNQIELFEKMLANDRYIHTWETIRLHLGIAEIALAALTAEPVGEVVDVGGSRMVEWDRCISEGARVYTTPPAQLLRPVVLPDESFSEEEEWEKYQAMSGCQKAKHRARLCWAAMLAAVPGGQ